jgi:glycosyltransferase involved in cell wall biosynthesis
MARTWAGPGRLRKVLQFERLDAVHFPLSVMIPPPGSAVPAAVTVHDLQHELYPRFFSRSELAYRRVLYRRSVRSSRIVIAISEHARETLLTRYGLDPSRVVAIPLGIDHLRLRPAEEPEPREPFLLYPANPWPHKNHARLYEAFALARRDRPELRLVLTGTGHDPRALPDAVESRGRVPYDELVRLYRTASALVFPSLYEGFGLPPLEAMACGCPVAVSRATSLPEVCGDAAEYFDPLSPEDMARAVGAVLDDPALYVQRGVARARLYTWESTARAHEDVYRRLAA